MRFRYATAAAAVVSSAAILLTTPGIAGAATTVEPIPGRTRIKVVLHDPPVNPDSCRLDPDFGTPNTQSVGFDPTGVAVAHNVAPGTRRVTVWCPQGGVIFDGPVDVLPADPIADVIDTIFRTAGSSDRVTDPTLR